jgi:hypothetical protein
MTFAVGASDGNVASECGIPGLLRTPCVEVAWSKVWGCKEPRNGSYSLSQGTV